VQEEEARAHPPEPPHVAGEQELALLVAERGRRRRQRGARVAAQRLAQLGLAHHAPAELVDRVDAHRSAAVVRHAAKA